MRSHIFALGLAGVAAAAYAPEAPVSPSYGGDSAPAAPASPAVPVAPTYGEGEVPSAPSHESTSSTPAAPGYGWESTSESVPAVPETTSAPASPESTSAPAYGVDTTVTDVVSAFTTYCPQAMTLTHGGKTYTVSSATTLTITACYGGCAKTQSAPVPTWAPSTSASLPNSPVETSPSAPAYGGPSSATWATSTVGGAVPYYPTGTAPNGTAPAGTGSPSASASMPAAYTAGASTVAAGAMVGLCGLFAALFL